jgi:hypothetical protein
MYGTDGMYGILYLKPFFSVSDCWSFFCGEDRLIFGEEGREEDGSGEEQTLVPL